MSYRIWINVFGMPFMSTRTESNFETADGIARALAKALPDCVVGVDRVENESVWRRIGESVRHDERPRPTQARSGSTSTGAK